MKGLTQGIMKRIWNPSLDSTLSPSQLRGVCRSSPPRHLRGPSSVLVRRPTSDVRVRAPIKRAPLRTGFAPALHRFRTGFAPVLHPLLASAKRRPIQSPTRTNGPGRAPSVRPLNDSDQFRTGTAVGPPVVFGLFSVTRGQKTCFR